MALANPRAFVLGNGFETDFDNPASPVVATEVVGTSVTSDPPYERFVSYLPDNPHVKFVESRERTYVSVELSQARIWR